MHQDSQACENCIEFLPKRSTRSPQICLRNLPRSVRISRAVVTLYRCAPVSVIFALLKCSSRNWTSERASGPSYHLGDVQSCDQTEILNRPSDIRNQRPSSIYYRQTKKLSIQNHSSCLADPNVPHVVCYSHAFVVRHR